MKHEWLVLSLLLAPASVLPAQTPIKLTLRPAAEPVPALKYQFLPELQDMTPGNAALLYQRAHSPDWFNAFRQKPEYKKYYEWFVTPLKELPREQIRNFLPRAALREVDLAARRESCDWELTSRLRKEGIQLLMADLQAFREFANLLRLRARLEMADGDPDKALYTLQTGFALARHLGEAPSAISVLVGLAISNIMIKQVEELVELVGSPNYYWALTALPRPLVDFRNALQGEKLLILAEAPELREIESGRFTTQQQRAFLDKVARLRFLHDDHQGGPNVPDLVKRIDSDFPQAKQALLAQGYKADELDGLPPMQVVGIWSYRHYRRMQDDMFKWMHVPLRDAHTNLLRMHKEIGRVRKDNGTILFADFFFSTYKVAIASAGQDRRLAALRCIEALRLQAARDGKFPEKLSDVTVVPVPEDPFTGTPFEYERKGNKATLIGPPLPGEPDSYRINMLQYELNLAE